MNTGSTGSRKHQNLFNYFLERKRIEEQLRVRYTNQEVDDVWIPPGTPDQPINTIDTSIDTRTSILPLRNIDTRTNIGNTDSTIGGHGRNSISKLTRLKTFKFFSTAK